MSDVIKITIKGCSGFCCYEDAYDDKLTLTSSSISYDYVPVCESEKNSLRKWTYKTNSPRFKMAFEQIVNMMPDILQPKTKWECTDVGMIDFTITYSDKTRKHIRYWCTGDPFNECFSIIKKMVPKMERIPEVLK